MLESGPFDPLDLAPPAYLPPRTHKNALSPFYLMHCGERVHVPWHALVRDRMPIEYSEETAPSVHNTSYNEIVVLRALHQNGAPKFGWFVKRSSKRLDLISRRMCVQLSIACRAYSPRSRLVHWCPDSRFVDPSLEFLELAVLRFQRVRHVLSVAAMKLRRSSSAADAENHDAENHEEAACKPHVSAAKSSPQTHNTRSNARKRKRFDCAICLGDEICDASDKQCCGVFVCSDCDTEMRGLCPICQRSCLSGHFACPSCGEFHTKDFAGYPCATCGDSAVCRQCYCAFGECAFCDGVSN